MLDKVLNSKSIVLIVTVLVVIALISYILNKFPDLFLSARSNIQENKTGKDSNAIVTTDGTKADLNAIARGFRNAMNPSGAWWLSDVDGTDEEAIFNLARQSKGYFNDVARTYKALYEGDDLLTHLEDELGAEDFQKFRENAGI